MHIFKEKKVEKNNKYKINKATTTTITKHNQ